MKGRKTSNKAQAISPLEAHLGYWVRFVSNHVSYAFSAKLAGRDVTVAEWVILRELYEHESVAPSRLADDLRMTRGAISKLIDRLVEKALVDKTQGENDRRTQQVALTQKGRLLLPELAAFADENDAEFFGHLTADERSTLQNVLEDIVRRRRLATIPID
jgi:DNA-binding MarR family transcriptional regulator